MDTVEATKMVMSRIQKLDQDNASKIMGYILIQDQGENEMIRLAFGPENLLHSVIKKAKSFLDISSNTSSTHPQIMIPSNGYHPSSPNSPWSLSGSVSGSFSGSVSGSYAAVVNNGSGSSFLYPGFDDELGPGQNGNGSGHGSLFDECSTNSESAALFPYSFDGGSNNWCNETSNNINMGNNNHHLHRRSCSVNDVFLGGDDVSGGGFGGWRPCMYYNRGFCKNGTACKFVHGNGNNMNSNGLVEEMGLGGSGCSGGSGSPNGKMEAFEDLVRIKAMQQQQQRMAAMNGGPFGFNRCMNFLNENPRSAAAAALMMGDDFHKFGRCRPDRNDFGPMGFGSANSSSRQIYLTFPADSTFKEEDVSNYFSMFGPVQDVRIPYQQKRMFGFVTFMLPETVKAILAKGNPHFVCDSRVLVKPYKEKGKIPDKKHQQQMERGDFSGCLSPTALESAEPFDHIPFGARMFNHEMMIRRKIEERELQQAIEFQDRRLMNLQLNDLNNHHFQRSLSLGGAVSSPTQTTQNLMFSFDGNNEEPVSGANISTQDSMNSAGDASDTNGETTKNESFEQALPDNLFASPTRSTTTDNQTNFSNDMPETDYGAAIPVHVTSKCQAIEM